MWARASKAAVSSGAARAHLGRLAFQNSHGLRSGSAKILASGQENKTKTKTNKTKAKAKIKAKAKAKAKGKGKGKV